MSALGVSVLGANARMYAVTPEVGRAWDDLFAWVGRRSGVPLTPIEHPAPAPLEALWSRPDLGLAFVCGYPFARGTGGLQPVAAPVPSPDRYGGRPRYWTDLVVPAASGIGRLPDAFGTRIGWTTAQSQSGFNALRHHLLPYRERREAWFRESVGPLVTPRRVVDALLSGVIDIGPLDSYVHDLLRLHEPATADALRTVASTAPTPIPLLAASPGVAPETVARLRETLLGAGDDPEGAARLAPLLLRGFAPVEPEAYRALLDQADATERAGYRQIG